MLDDVIANHGPPPSKTCSPTIGCHNSEPPKFNECVPEIAMLCAVPNAGATALANAQAMSLIPQDNTSPDFRTHFPQCPPLLTLFHSTLPCAHSALTSSIARCTVVDAKGFAGHVKPCYSISPSPCKQKVAATPVFPHTNPELRSTPATGQHL